MKRTAGLVAAVILGVVAGIFGTLIFHSDNTNAPQADHVVGVLKRCKLPGETGTVEIEGAACVKHGLEDFSHLEVAVRTGNGTTYTLNLPPDTVVSVGDPWPPKP